MTTQKTTVELLREALDMFVVHAPLRNKLNEALRSAEADAGLAALEELEKQLRARLAELTEPPTRGPITESMEMTVAEVRRWRAAVLKAQGKTPP